MKAGAWCKEAMAGKHRAGYHRLVIQPQRIRVLRQAPARGGRYVLYWMQQSQRTDFSHALEYAVERANEAGLPLVVCFGLMDDYPEANERHYAFMLQGLADVQRGLEERGIRFVVKRGAPADVALHYAGDAAMVICDRGYLRHQRRWREQVADGARCPVIEVESDAVVPVEEASDKAEYAARTIRPKIQRKLHEYLVPLKQIAVARPSLGLGVRGDVDVSDPDAVLAAMKVDRSVPPSAIYRGGQAEARRRLKAFVASGLKGYATGRNEPAADATSHLSPYLHFGQISPLQIALAVRDADAPAEDRQALLEELIVRRELAMNFVTFTANYDRYECIPQWARQTLKQHQGDPRPHLYTREQLESAQTHDRWWNAAQRQMVRSGFMHNYMRMYWGKKIIEWSKTPQEAYATALYLNNKHLLDGRDPASYMNVAWLFGLHDRPWTRRPIFGTVRYMNAAGLERKFDMEAYAAAEGT